MKKLILTMLLLFSFLNANTLLENNNERIMDKVYLDIYLEDEINYQYIHFDENFQINTKKLEKVFDLYRTKNLHQGKFIITGKFALPEDVGNKVTIGIRGVTTTNSTLYSQKTGKIGVYTYLNEIKLQDKKMMNVVDVQKDDNGLAYVSIKIETEFIKRELFLEHFKLFIANMKFFLSYEAQQSKRGDTNFTKEMPLRAFVFKNDSTFKYD